MLPGNEIFVDVQEYDLIFERELNPDPREHDLTETL